MKKLKQKAGRPAKRLKAPQTPAPHTPRGAGKPFPKGYDCAKCGRFNPFPLYVAAHAEERLQHTCRCGARHSILNGIAKQVKP